MPRPAILTGLAAVSAVPREPAPPERAATTSGADHAPYALRHRNQPAATGSARATGRASLATAPTAREPEVTEPEYPRPYPAPPLAPRPAATCQRGGRHAASRAAGRRMRLPTDFSEPPWAGGGTGCTSENCVPPACRRRCGLFHRQWVPSRHGSFALSTSAGICPPTRPRWVSCAGHRHRRQVVAVQISRVSDRI